MEPFLRSTLKTLVLNPLLLRVGLSQSEWVLAVRGRDKGGGGSVAGHTQACLDGRQGSREPPCVQSSSPLRQPPSLPWASPCRGRARLRLLATQSASSIRTWWEWVPRLQVPPFLCLYWSLSLGGRGQGLGERGRLHVIRTPWRERRPRRWRCSIWRGGTPRRGSTPQTSSCGR